VINVSDHGRKRIKQRCGLPKKAAQRFAEKAFKNGITYSECAGGLKRYLSFLWEYNHTANNIRVYANKVFIFADETIVTVLNLPKRYYETVKKIKEARYVIKNDS
jgi:hypothetical protein